MRDSTGRATEVFWPVIGGIPAPAQMPEAAATAGVGLDMEQMVHYGLSGLEGAGVDERTEVWNDWGDALAEFFSVNEPRRKTATLVRVPHSGHEGTYRAVVNRLLLHGWHRVETRQALPNYPAGPYSLGSMSDNMLQHMQVYTAMLAAVDEAWLEEAIADLDAISEAAREDELPEPDPEAIANARSLLPRLYAILPVRYRVAPTERRGVSIDAPMKRGGAVAVECAPDDTVYCFATIGGNSRRAKFYQMDGLPDVFIEKALRDLAAG